MGYLQQQQEEEEEAQQLLQHGLPPWSQLSFVLSKEIIKNDLHTTFLNSTESQHFETAVESYTQWYAFINGNNKDLQSYPISERAISAMRVRAMLAEQFIPHLYHSDRLCCQHAQKIDLGRICQETRSLQLPDIPPSSSTINNNNGIYASSSPQQQLPQRSTESQSITTDSEIPLVPVKKEDDNNKDNGNNNTTSMNSIANAATTTSSTLNNASNEDTGKPRL